MHSITAFGIYPLDLNFAAGLAGNDESFSSQINFL
jgi:hypothetical protein